MVQPGFISDEDMMALEGATPSAIQAGQNPGFISDEDMLQLDSRNEERESTPFGELAAGIGIRGPLLFGSAVSDVTSWPFRRAYEALSGEKKSPVFQMTQIAEEESLPTLERLTGWPVSKREDSNSQLLGEFISPSPVGKWKGLKTLGSGLLRQLGTGAGAFGGYKAGETLAPNSPWGRFIGAITGAAAPGAVIGGGRKLFGPLTRAGAEEMIQPNLVKAGIDEESLAKALAESDSTLPRTTAEYVPESNFLAQAEEEAAREGTILPAMRNARKEAQKELVESLSPGGSEDATSLLGESLSARYTDAQKAAGAAFLKEQEHADDIIAAALAKKEADINAAMLLREQEAAAKESALEAAISPLMKKKVDVEYGGQLLARNIAEGETAAHKIASDAYTGLPNVEVNLGKAQDKFLDAEDLYTGATNKVAEKVSDLLSPNTLDTQAAINVRSELSKDAWKITDVKARKAYQGIIDGLDEAIEDSLSAYPAAKATYRNYKQTYYEGVVGKITEGDLQPSKMLGAATKSVENIDEVTKAAASPAAIRSSIEGVFANKAITQEGKLNRAGAKAMLDSAEYAPVFRRFPGLKEELQKAVASDESLRTYLKETPQALREAKTSATMLYKETERAAKATLAEKTKSLQKAVVEFGKKGAGKFATQNATTALASIMYMSPRAVKEFMGTLSKTELENFRQGAYQFIKRTIADSPTDTKLKNLLTKNKSSIEEVLGKGAIKKLEDLSANVKSESAKFQRAKLGDTEGSATARGVKTPALNKLIGKGNPSALKMIGRHANAFGLMTFLNHPLIAGTAVAGGGLLESLGAGGRKRLVDAASTALAHPEEALRVIRDRAPRQMGFYSNILRQGGTAAAEAKPPLDDLLPGIGPEEAQAAEIPASVLESLPQKTPQVPEVQYQDLIEMLVPKMIYKESKGNANAISPSGAQGLMQLMPKTGKYLAEKYGVEYDPFNPEQNQMLGTMYLRELLEQFDGDPQLALAAYNAGPGNVSKWVREFGTTDWEEISPKIKGFKETKNYVSSIYG